MGVIYRNGIAYGGAASIDAHSNEILVGDGSDWAKKNIANLYITKRTDIDSGTVAAIYSTEDNIELKNMDGSSNTTNVLRVFNNSKIKAFGGADIEIGDKDADYSQSGRTFWDNDLTAPTIKVGGTTFIELLGGDSESQIEDDTPAISMRGRCLVDMRGSRALDNNNKKYNRKYSQYLDYAIYGNGYVNPFDTSENFEDATVAFPYLHMHDTSSIIMDGGPILKMEGNASANIAGDVFLSIHGENDISTPTEGPGAIERGTGGIWVDMRPGAVLSLGAGSSSTAASPKTSVLKISEADICAIGQLARKTDLTNTDIYNHYMLTSSPISDMHLSHRSMINYCNNNLDNSSAFIFSECMLKPWSSDIPSTLASLNSNWLYKGPILHVHDNSYVNIGDGGVTGIKIGGESNTETVITIDPKANAAFEAKLGSNSYAVDAINVTNGSNSITRFNHSAEPNALTNYELFPKGNTEFRFAPRKTFLMNASPEETEFLWQWKSGYVFLQGDNNFMLLDGAQTHVENVGNIFIMRDDTTEQNYPGDSNYRFGGSWDYDKDNPFDITDISDAYFETCPERTAALNAFDTAKTDLPHSDAIDNPTAKLMCGTGYEGGASAGHDWYYRYYTVTVPTTVILQRIGAFTFSSTTEYATLIAAISSPEALAIVHSEIGNDMTNLTGEGGKTWTKTQTADGWDYSISTPRFQFNETFTAEQLSDTIAVQPLPINTAITNSAYPEIYSIIRTKYTVGSYSIYSSSAPKVYAVGTSTGENKWQRWIQIDYNNDAQANVDWSQPIQTNSTGDAKPVFQMYNRANLMMRADTIHKTAQNEYTERPVISTYTYTFTSTETYDLTDVNAAIRAFIAGPDYSTFIAAIASGYELWRITNFTQDQNNYTITYTRKETGYTEFLTSPQAQEPILEMVGGSELRMYLGAYITAKTEYGETTITFGSRNSNESPVSFTLAELAALKTLLAQPRLAQMTEAEYQQLDPPDPNTVYVLNSGGN